MLQKEFEQRGLQAKISNSPDQHTQGLILLDAIDVAKTLKNSHELTEFYLSAFEKIKAISKNFSEKGGVLISVQDTGGQFGLETNLDENKALTAGLTGIVKTAALEWPKARCRALDIVIKNHSPEKIAKAIFQEVQDVVLSNYQLDELEFGVPNCEKKQRIKLVAAPEKIHANNKKTLLKKSVLVVTGGARGITAASLIALSKKQPLKLALLGRSELTPEPAYCLNLQDKESIKKAIIQEAKHLKTPKQIEQTLNQIIAHREILQTISLLESLGSEVMYFSVDVTDQHSLYMALDKIRKQFGRIDGIVHGAGVLADKLITEKTAEQFKRVFDTKITGLLNLLKETEKDALQYLILFSSVAGRYGNIGQVDYACANEVLNKIAQVEKKRHKNCIVKSLNWAPWDSGMVDEQLKKMFEQRNIPVLSVKAGTDIFVQEMCDNDPRNAEIIYGGLLDEKKMTTKFDINSQTDNFILSHQIKDQAVLPACLVLDWFVRSISQDPSFYDADRILECRDFKVLKGVKLEGFSSGQHFSFEIQSQSPTHLKLLDENKLPRYSVEFVFKHANVDSAKKRHSDINKNQWPFALSKLYQSENPDAPLFHGKHFQGIEALGDYSSKGGSAILRPMTKMEQSPWPHQNWQIDVLAIDCALQLLLLWTHSMLGKGSLPTQIEKIVLYQKTLPNDWVACEFKSQMVDKLKTRSDVQLFDQNGKIIAELMGVEMCVVL